MKNLNKAINNEIFISLENSLMILFKLINKIIINLWKIAVINKNNL